MRTATTITAVLAAITLAACGSDAPKVSSSEYIDRCKSEVGDRVKEQSAVKISDQQIADICQCTQDRLVAEGLGDKSIDDEELTKEKGQELGRDCTIKVLTGKG